MPRCVLWWGVGWSGGVGWGGVEWGGGGRGATHNRHMRGTINTHTSHNRPYNGHNRHNRRNTQLLLHLQTQAAVVSHHHSHRANSHETVGASKHTAQQTRCCCQPPCTSAAVSRPAPSAAVSHPAPSAEAALSVSHPTHRVRISSFGFTMLRCPRPSCAPILTSRMMFDPMTRGIGRFISLTASSSAFARSLQQQ